MEMERSTADQVAKKMWSLVRAVVFMLRKGLLKGKLVLDLHFLFKRGKLASKAIGDLMIHHYSAVSCRAEDTHLSFVSPREYEFSCSNSPTVDYAYLHHQRRSRHGHGHGFGHHHYSRRADRIPKPDMATLAAVQRVLEMLNNEAAAAEASPVVALPGFGKSPMARQLRITDSPFPLKDDVDSHQVDVAAEEFIKNFYKDLRSQKINTAAVESPYHYRMWR